MYYTSVIYFRVVFTVEVYVMLFHDIVNMLSCEALETPSIHMFSKCFILFNSCEVDFL